MFSEIITILLGIFTGLYASFVGTAGGAAIMIYVLQYLNIIKTDTMIAGTMLFVSAIPISLLGLTNYFKHKEINFYIGSLIIIGLSIGIFIGSKYAFIVNDKFGEKYGDKIKNTITALIYAVLASLYFYRTIND